MKKLLALTLVLVIGSGFIGVGYSALALDDIAPLPSITDPTNAQHVVNINASGTVRLVGKLVDAYTTTTMDQRQFTVTLSGSNEIPAITSTAVGAATLSINGDNTAHLKLDFSGLTSTETGAHIHGPASTGENAPVLITLPLGTLDNHPLTLTTEQRQMLESGLLYINVHSEQYPDGEIRGQLQASTVTTPLTHIATSTTATTTADTVTGTIATSTPFTRNSIILVVNAWGFNWRVMINSSTLIMRNESKIVDLEKLAMNDQLTISGYVATSTSLMTTSTNAGPLIVAKSIRDQSWINRTVTGQVGAVTLTGVNTTTTDSSATTSFTTSFTLLNEDIRVLVDDRTVIRLGGRPVNSDSINSNGTARVKVKGYFNLNSHVLYALDISIEENTTETSTTTTTTTTDTTTPSSKAGPLPAETPDTSYPPKPYEGTV